MDRMARPLCLTALASLLVTLACANTPEPGASGSAVTGQTPPSTSQAEPAKPALAGTATRPDLLATPIPVASAPADGRPCEHMCGRVGDCLREAGDSTNAGHLRDAGHLELTCLDLCVNVNPSSDAGKRFRACETHDSCDPLLDCTRKGWDAAANARGTVVTQIDAAPSFNTCELVCGGMYACMDLGVPLHQMHDRSEQFERDLKVCLENCDPQSEVMMALADCAREQTCEQQWECWQQAQNY